MKLNFTRLIRFSLTYILFCFVVFTLYLLYTLLPFCHLLSIIKLENLQVQKSTKKQALPQFWCELRYTEYMRMRDFYCLCIQSCVLSINIYNLNFEYEPHVELWDAQTDSENFERAFFGALKVYFFGQLMLIFGSLKDMKEDFKSYEV